MLGPWRSSTRWDSRSAHRRSRRNPAARVSAQERHAEGGTARAQHHARRRRHERVLDKAECKRTASAAHAGLARALNPSHTLADGDTVFCLATGALALDRSSEAARQVSLITLQSAAADVVRLAILDGITCAEAVSTPAGEFGAYGR